MNFSTRIKFFPFFALSLLPFFMLYILSDVAFFILFYLTRYRRKVVHLNLRNSYPTKSEVEIRTLEKHFYRHFCDIMLELIKILTISKKSVKERFKVQNPLIIQELFNQKRSIILYTAHQGNWEWLAFLPLFIPHQAIAFYQPQSNAYFDSLMKIIRGRFGVICVESNKGYKTIHTFAHDNILTVTYIIGDQSPQKDSTMHWVKFLNQDTAFLIGADRIAKKSNQVVIFPSFSKTKRGHYNLEFKIIETNASRIESFEIIEKYASMLEKTIAVSPEMWLWSHKRWKLKEVEEL